MLVWLCVPMSVVCLCLFKVGELWRSRPRSPADLIYDDGDLPRHPGPSSGAVRARRDGDLMDVALVSEQTLQRGRDVKRRFAAWLMQGGVSIPLDTLITESVLIIPLIHSYGRAQYTEGRSLSDYRQLLAALQRDNLSLRGRMPEAWDLVSRWQSVEPTCHRTPLPRAICLAMIAVALQRGHRRWAACLMIAFEGICRIGEVLRPSCRRHNLILPSESWGESPHAYLRVDQPKTGMRGGATVQHARITDAPSIMLLESIFSGVTADERLYPWSVVHFRDTWDTILASLLVPPEIALTPGGVRGGGAVAAYHRQVPIADILWQMRLRSQEALAHYLQEVAALNVTLGLSEECRASITAARNCLTLFLANMTPRGSRPPT